LRFQPFVIPPFAVDGLAALLDPDAGGDLVAGAPRSERSDGDAQVLGELGLVQLVALVDQFLCCRHGDSSPAGGQRCGMVGKDRYAQGGV